MEYLLTASIMSAPAALLCAKINMPDDTDNKELSSDSKGHTTKLDINNRMYVFSNKFGPIIIHHAILCF